MAAGAAARFPTREAALQKYSSEPSRPEFAVVVGERAVAVRYVQADDGQAKRRVSGRDSRTCMVIGANHILSMIDAFSTIRLRAAHERERRRRRSARAMSW